MDHRELEFEPQREASAAAEFWAVHDANDQVIWQSDAAPSDPDVQWLSMPLNIKATHESAGATLTLRVGASTRPMRRELTRIRQRLWLFGPAAFLCLSVVIVTMIRWQLKPLSRIAEAAHAIDAMNMDADVRSDGTAPEYRALEQALNGMIRRLAEGMARERLFTASAAHELRTPLAQMRLGIEVALRKQRDPVEYDKILHQSLEDLSRLQALIEALLQLSRPITPDAQNTALSTIIETIRSQHPTVTLPSVAPEPDLMIRGPKTLLEIALNNLIDNACRYGGETTPPEITLDAQAQHVTFCISDHGPGIAEPDRQRIFEPLVRLDAARTITDDQQGFGLGLAIARQIAERFGGHITCHARADGQPGAAFSLTLPRA